MMNWKHTWILVSLAAALFAFIMLFERRLDPGGKIAPGLTLFAKFRPTAATVIQFRREKQFALALERTNDAWHFQRPVYPAAGFAVQQFLEALERAVPATHITDREMRAHQQTSAAFGFDPPSIVIGLEKGGERRELSIGVRTPAGDQVYVEIAGQPGVFVVDAALLERMPRTPYDWRDTVLFELGGGALDRAEITRGTAGFELRLDATNQLWRLTRQGHRADQLQVAQLIKKILEARAVAFVTDNPGAEADGYGLVAPEFEVTLASGATVRKVQFGRSPTNDPLRVYARILTHSNVVLVPRGVVDLLATPYDDLRERQLAPFAPELVDVIEVRGEENFTVRKDAAGAWKAGDVPADPIFLGQWLERMAGLEVTNFVKDVVTAFAPYGLDPARFQYTLRTTVTNAAGATNLLIAQTAFGAGTNASDDRIYARRLDEESVYAIRPFDYLWMPGAVWQVRDHRVWNFTTNQVVRVGTRQDDGGRDAVRQPGGEWLGARGWDGDFNPLAMEEIAFQLGELRAMVWIARGEGVRERYGFTTNSPQISVDLRGEKPQTLTVEFGGPSPLRLPYALTVVDGQPVVFLFPWTLYYDLQRHFKLAAFGPPRNRAAANGR